MDMVTSLVKGKWVVEGPSSQEVPCSKTVERTFYILLDITSSCSDISKGIYIGDATNGWIPIYLCASFWKATAQQRTKCRGKPHISNFGVKFEQCKRAKKAKKELIRTRWKYKDPTEIQLTWRKAKGNGRNKRHGQQPLHSQWKVPWARRKEKSRKKKR